MSEKQDNKQTKSAETYAFKAETKQLLDILIHSLYKDHEVFLRELISNASDALNRMRFEMLTNRNVLEPDLALDIHISVNKDERLLVIEDSGIGMTKEEIIENLGTIAQSGAREFVKAAGESKKDLIQVIGQFGVGFYSVFMVAEWVKVTSRSFLPEASPISWYAVGDDSFKVEPADKVSRGTRIEIKLKDESKEFLEEYRLKEVIRKHSEYVGYPIFMGEDKQQVNKQTSIWRTSKQEVSEEQFKDFYRQLTLDLDDPMMHIHLVTDAPVQIYSMLFIPSKAERGILSIRREDGLKLYSKNILIDEYCKDLLPEYLRFIQGIVDCEDLPLNVSRETIQATGMMTKLKKIITGQVLKELHELARADHDMFISFWKEYGVFLKQGIASNQPESDQIQGLLRFKTDLNVDDWTSLEDYIQRMQVGQKEIFYIIGDEPKSILRSPHLDYFNARKVEVLLLTEPIDSFMLLGLHKYKEFELKNVTSGQPELPVIEDEESKREEKSKPIPDEEMKGLTNLFKEVLGERVQDVRTTDKLTRSIARLVDPEGSMNPELQRVYKLLEKEYETPKKILELNPVHPILGKLVMLEGEDVLKKNIVEQVYESALLMEGLHPDPASMVNRLEWLMETVLERKSPNLP